MIDRDGLVLDLAQAVNELVKERTHVENYRVHEDGHWHLRRHVTHVASLLNQLRTAVEASGSSQDGPRPAFGSKPVARLEAIDRLQAIEDGCWIWLVRRLGQTPRTTVEGNLRELVGLAPNITTDLLEALTSEVRRWRVWARVTTGWDEPPFRPANTCPACEERGTLRIRVMDRLGTCVACGSAWGPDTIGLLADAIRAENGDERLDEPA